MLRNRLGMTLIELALSISLLGLVLLGLHGLVDALTLADTRLSVRVTDTARHGIGHRLLFDLFARVGTSGGDGAEFMGTVSETTFRSWCESSVGLLERCFVRIRIRRDPDIEVLEGVLSGSTVVPLVEGPPGMHLIYLDGPDTSARWVRGWRAGLDTPSALGIVTVNDTLLVPIGAAR